MEAILFQVSNVSLYLSIVGMSLLILNNVYISHTKSNSCEKDIFIWETKCSHLFSDLRHQLRIFFCHPEIHIQLVDCMEFDCLLYSKVTQQVFGSNTYLNGSAFFVTDSFGKAGKMYIFEDSDHTCLTKRRLQHYEVQC